LELHYLLQSQQHSIVKDRCIYEVTEVITKTLYKLGEINERDWLTYYSLYETIVHFLRPPDLLIYLQASPATLLKRIKQRGRKYEGGIDKHYLDSLSQQYQRWIASWTYCPVLIIDIDESDTLAPDTLEELVVSINLKVL
jgi:deoxyadenosine/deoxycytidine kinase